MFSFEIIESKKEIFENQHIDLITKKMKFFPDNQDDVMFILGEEKKILRGGACLVKKRLKNIQEEVREFVAPLPLHSYVWECSTICLETSYKDSVPETPELDYFFQGFYRGLYREFVEFGRMKGVGFLIMKLASEVYNSTKEWGLWPYVVELKPGNSPDGLFHGVLPLTGSQYKAYQESLGICLLKSPSIALEGK